MNEVIIKMVPKVVSSDDQIKEVFQKYISKIKKTEIKSKYLG